MLRLIQAWAPGREATGHRPVHTGELFHFFVGLERDSLDCRSELLDIGANGCQLGRDLAVVAFDNGQIRHGLARDRLALAGLPIEHHATWLHGLPGSVMQQRDGDDVFADAQVLGAHRRECPRHRHERVVVGSGLPRRVDGGIECMHERVHVGRGEILLLVPSRGRQQDVGEQARRRHPEVHRDH